MINQGTQKYCPVCKEIVLTHVLNVGYSQVKFNGVLVKRRKIIHPIDNNGNPGCGSTWYTLEIPEDALNRLSPSSETE